MFRTRITQAAAVATLALGTAVLAPAASAVAAPVTTTAAGSPASAATDAGSAVHAVTGSMGWQSMGWQ
ncbi:hypothetical protein ACSNOH_04260 [Streptomyces sp. URMC 127]|uniref:hypothetical protein n=1 Tax=Streptomyces sp. URMC 127 TaxID=3423402 RepID=UPI003F1B273F